MGLRFCVFLSAAATLLYGAPSQAGPERVFVLTQYYAPPPQPPAYNPPVVSPPAYNPPVVSPPAYEPQPPQFPQPVYQTPTYTDPTYYPTNNYPTTYYRR